MEKKSKITAILIPGANPGAAKDLFNAIKIELEKIYYEANELEVADESQLFSKGQETPVKILIGKSLGGRLVVDYQLKYQDCQALVLLAPAVRTNNKYTEINIPVLIIHGTDDKTIPIENSRKLKNFFTCSTLEEISNTDHGFTGKLAEVAKVISKWLLSIIG